jgi:NTE family protein
MGLKITQPVQMSPGAILHRAPFTTDVVLSDGGVYDNLGLENPWKISRTILVSDGGQKIAPEETPAHNWAEHAMRVLDIIDNQVRSLRKRNLITAYRNGICNGTYWGIRTRFTAYPVARSGATDPLSRADRDPSALAAVPTRLEALDDTVQEQLINWGYAISDAALASHWESASPGGSGTFSPSNGFPYPSGY